MILQADSLPWPWGNCSSSAADSKLKYYDEYQRSRCVIECETEALVETCGCRDAYMPHDSKGEH